MAGPLDELVKRILRRIEVFKDEHGLGGRRGHRRSSSTARSTG